MSVTLVLQADLVVETANGHRLRIPNGNSLVVLDAPDLDAAAEIIENVSRGALQANASQFNREEITEGMSSQVTYGPGGEKYAENQGVPPGLESATISDAANTLIVATFFQDVNSPSENFLLGFSCKVEGVARAISDAVRVNVAVIHFTLASAVAPEEEVLLSYNNATGDIESLTGGELQSFTDEVVVNNVTT